MMSDEELDKVAGGNMTEVNEIIMSVGKVVEHSGTYNGKPAKMMWYLDGNREISSYLKKTYNIDSELDDGWVPGSGGYYFENGGDPNTYSINGKSISHQQVLDIIKASKG